MSESEIKPVAFKSEPLYEGSPGMLVHNDSETAKFIHLVPQWRWMGLYDQSAIDRLTAERDAAVADARQLRDFADIGKNRLIAAAKQARRCLAWACEQRPEFNAEYEALDAAIDAARAEGGV